VETDASGRPFTPQRIESSGDHALTVRQSTEDDVPGIMLLFESLSAEDAHRRFFSLIKVTDDFVRPWVQRCRDDGLGLVIVDDGSDGRIVAEAGYVLLPNGDADFAITVAPDRRGGLGSCLLDVLERAAAERGVRNLEADILTENRAMLALARRHGYATNGDTDYSVLHVIIGTEGCGPVWPPQPNGPKLLVEKPGSRWPGRAAAMAAGFDVLVCGLREQCPTLRGEPCPLADEADAIVVAFPRRDPRGRQLVRAHRRARGRVPVVLAPAAAEGRTECGLVSGRTNAALRAQLASVLRHD
jgi:RimJ/RimL family protein N-acetyltransferase